MTRLLLALLLGFAIASCETDPKSFLPSYTGQQGELIVVIDPSIVSSDYNELLFQSLNQSMPGLPQTEPMFKVIDLRPETFTELFKTHRNVLHIRLNPEAKAELKVLSDVRSQMQTVVIINAHSLDELKSMIDKDMQRILWLFHNKELERIKSRNRDFGSELANDRAAAISDLEIATQQGMSVAREEEDFLWLRVDRERPVGGFQHQISQGILIYSKPYTDTASFSDSALIQWKNEVNKKYVLGPQESHMETSFKLYPPSLNYVTFRGETAKEIRGLWRMEGYFMGGPFYALSFYNPENQRQYLVEGYVYAPQFDKRPFLREVEAIVKSVKPVAKSVE